MMCRGGKAFNIFKRIYHSLVMFFHIWRYFKKLNYKLFMNKLSLFALTRLSL
jgi:hypothetical protein